MKTTETTTITTGEKTITITKTVEITHKNTTMQRLEMFTKYAPLTLQLFAVVSAIIFGVLTVAGVVSVEALSIVLDVLGLF